MAMLFLRRCYPHMTSLNWHQLPSMFERQQERQVVTFGGTFVPGLLDEGRPIFITRYRKRGLE